MGLHVASVMQWRPSERRQVDQNPTCIVKRWSYLPRPPIPSLHKPSLGQRACEGLPLHFRGIGELGGYRESNKSTPFTKCLTFRTTFGRTCGGYGMLLGVFEPPLAFCKPRSGRDSDPVTVTLGWKAWFCRCSRCLTRRPGLHWCATCQSAPRTPLTISFLAKETAP